MGATNRKRAPAYREGTITRLTARKAGADRVAVYLDGSFAFDLAVVVADQADLRTGEVLTRDAQAQLVEQDEPYRARERALRFLAAKDRSRREVEVRLRTAGFGPDVVSETVSWLSGLGYVDDRRLVVQYIPERLKMGWGKPKIKAELLRRGVDHALVEEVLSAEEMGPGVTQAGIEAAMVLARRRFSRQLAEDPQTAMRRLTGFLARRGFDWESIDMMIRALSSEISGDEGVARTGRSDCDGFSSKKQAD